MMEIVTSVDAGQFYVKEALQSENSIRLHPCLA